MSGYQTAWARGSSSLPSDRIPPTNTSVASSKSAKGKRKESSIPKSKEVQVLEQLRDGLSSSVRKVPTRDPKRGCFCQAREHELSTYTPICHQCGLILCTLNQPQYACSHCTSPLLVPTALEALIASIEQSIADTLAKEEWVRQQAREEARRAVGAFPTLGPSPLPSSTNLSNVPGSLEVHPVNQPHKVLSLNSNSKKVTVTSYVKAPKVQKTAVVQNIVGETVEPEPRRVPRPPSDVPYSSKPQNIERPWMNIKEPVTYVPPPAENKQGSSKGKRKEKRSQRDGATQSSHGDKGKGNGES